MSNAPSYWRKNKKWSNLIGKTGTVVAATYIHVAETSRQKLTPYSYVVVDFGDHKQEMMGQGHTKLTAGDSVTCVLRKTSIPRKDAVIEYGIKAKKNTIK